MSYINCPRCGQKALTVATRCPHCGVPFDTPHPPYPEPGSRRTRAPLGLLVAALVVTLLAADAVRHGLTAPRAPAPTPVAVADSAPPVQRARPRPARPPQEAARTPTPIPPPVPAAAPATDSTSQLALAVPSPAPTPAPPVEVAPAVDSAPATPPDPEPGPPLPPGAGQRFASTWVNVHTDPSGSAPVVRILRPGESVRVDSITQGWYRVLADRQALGYVDGRYLDTSRSGRMP